MHLLDRGNTEAVIYTRFFSIVAANENQLGPSKNENHSCDLGWNENHSHWLVANENHSRPRSYLKNENHSLSQ
jgi:hypothetical protein